MEPGLVRQARDLISLLAFSIAAGLVVAGIVVALVVLKPQAEAAAEVTQADAATTGGGLDAVIALAPDPAR